MAAPAHRSHHVTFSVASRAPDRAETAAAPAAKASVLIVDDNARKRMALRSILLPLGYGLVEADSGLAALRCVLKQDFAVILLDIRMPGMDGMETAALIRKRMQSEMTPIIFITAHGRDEISNVDGYAEGAVDFIFAPVPPNDLRSKVTVFARQFIHAELLAAQARELRASADALRVLTEAAPIGIFQTDQEDRYTYTNTRWSEITGVAAEDAVGRTWDSIIGNGNLHELVAGTHDARLGRRREIVRPDGSSRVVVLTWRNLPAVDGVRAGAVGTLADVTAEAAAAAALSRARDVAVAATDMQKAFTASASHELRTPTAAILGFVEEVLESTTLSQEDRDLLEIVLRNGLRLSLLIDDLLILGRTEIDASMMHLEPTELIPLAERVVDDLASVAQAHDVNVGLDRHHPLPQAMADPRRLEQALTNLLSNAIKFTPRGGAVTVAVFAGQDDVRISVSDNGPGIDPLDLVRIFDRFYRSRAAVDSPVKGSGLGLTIARGMIEAQTGSIEVASELGSGSTFTIIMPVTAPSGERGDGADDE